MRIFARPDRWDESTGPVLEGNSPVESSPISRPLRKWLVLLLATAGLAGLLGAVGFERIGLSFQRLGWAGAGAVLACGLIESLLDGWALRKAALDRVPFPKVLLINQKGAFLNLFIPGEAGEFLKAGLLNHHSSDGSTAVLVWNMISRLVKSSFILGLAAAAFFFLPASLPTTRGQAAVFLGCALLNSLVYAVLALVIRRGGVGRILRLASRLPFLMGQRTQRVFLEVETAERQTARFRHEHPARYLAVLLGLGGARLAGLVTTCVALSFLAPGTPFFVSVLVYAALELAGYVVAVLPTRVGTMEGSAFLVFEFLGLDGSLGTILQLALRLKQALINGAFTLGSLRGHR